MWIPGTVKTVLGLDWKERKKIYEFTYQIIKEAGEDVLGVTEKILFTLYENLFSENLESLKRKRNDSDFFTSKNF